MKKIRWHLRSGFTLMELLVVIAIIGILSSYILSSVNQARIKARDAKRIAGVREIQKALDIYYNENRTYPPANTTACNPATNNLYGLEVLIPDFMPSPPRDPNGTDGAGDNCFMYATPTGSGTQLTYHVGASLEDSTNQALSHDREFDSATAGYTNGFNGASSGKCNASHIGTSCYDQTP